MQERSIVDTSRLGRRRARSAPKGRQVDAQALSEVRALLGDAPRQRDLLVEFLHRIQDAYGSISAGHIVALAQEMRLALTEVYEVATFYHHFDVVKEGDAAPPRVTVRVCETLSCQMAGSHALLEELKSIEGAEVRVIGAPCIGRCDHAPAAVVGRCPIDGASVATVAAALEARRLEPDLPAYTDLKAYRREGGYGTLLECTSGKRTADAVIAELENSALRGLGGAGFPTGR
jgi:formate dehydrogenase